MPLDFRPLAELLSPGAAANEELHRVVSVLLRSAYPDDQLVQIVPCRWLGRRLLCLSRLCGQPADDAVGTAVDFVASYVQDVDQRPPPTELVLVDPAKSSAWEDESRYLQQILEFVPDAKVVKWDAAKLRELILGVPPLALRYYPESVPDGPARLERIEQSRRDYDREFAKLRGKIQFVGMAVYKEETSSSVPMERIYIPLRVLPEGATDEAQATQTNPLTLLKPGARHVILGDPGSGKSTLVKFLALAGSTPTLRKRYGAQPDDRLPILVTLRQYADELKSRPDLDLLDYAVEAARSELGVTGLDREFFEYHLVAGKALVLLDGVDELPSAEFKATVRDRVGSLLRDYPGNTAVVTSRIVGYDQQTRYDASGFSHHRVARLDLDDIERFVGNWYAVRIESEPERKRNVDDLVRIVRDPESRALRELAENPLLLTIICLVHRIDAELPDERVVLYQKCTETLLNTWHTWKWRTQSAQNRNKVERRNCARMEAIAYWLHCSFEESEEADRRAVARYEDLKDFLADYIENVESPRDGDLEELAEVFLRFIKERAGLLIEVGEGLYSFVHLTFQEYLNSYA